MIPDTDRFAVCLPLVLAQEAPRPGDWSDPHNFSNDAHDPGGATMMGITQREYDLYRRHAGLPLRDVRLLARAEGEGIYRHSYWLPDCPHLPPGLDLCFFDESVNAGPHAAVKLLQRTLGIPADGIWGPVTGAAVTHLPDVIAAIDHYTARREAYYRSLRGFAYFGSGWLRRARTICGDALRMARA